MGIHFHYEEPRRDICYVVFEPLWMWDDFDAQIDAMKAEIRALPYPVATLMDLTRSGRLPNGNVLAHLQRADSLMPDNTDFTVLVNAPYAFVNFVSILMRIRPRVSKTTFFAHSLDEGHSLICERRKHNASISSKSCPRRAVG
jgi:hypothetical protein